MKGMKGYLSEWLALHHIGKDEKQTENVCSMYKNAALWFPVYVEGNVGCYDHLLSEHVWLY